MNDSPVLYVVIYLVGLSVHFKFKLALELYVFINESILSDRCIVYVFCFADITSNVLFFFSIINDLVVSIQ